ncbi:MAG: hypothetical protein AABX10_03210 [Nanoarchaeota archaeon]
MVKKINPRIDEAYVRAHIRDMFGDENPEQRNVNSVRATMRKYADNRWWESKDPVTLARHQFFENCMIVPFSSLHKGFNEIVGRDTYDSEVRSMSVESFQQHLSRYLSTRLN